MRKSSKVFTISKDNLKGDQAFTLIELLVVIVIIGILAGVLISTINPFRQQNRARNAAIRAALQKVSFAINTSRASIGQLPASSELTTELENITTISDCTSDTDLDCTFKVSGVIMPETCTGNNVGGHSDTGNQCVFGVSSTGGSLMAGMFRVAAKQFKLDPADAALIYVFDSRNGLYSCPAESDYETVSLSTCTEVNE